MRRLSDAELNVMNVLWGGTAATSDATATATVRVAAASEAADFALGEIVDALKPATGWSRNTVHTYLTRMENKGLVIIDRSGEPHKYRAGVSREDCARRERSNLLDKLYGGATGDLIVAFLKENHISEEERDRLRQLLDEMEV